MPSQRFSRTIAAGTTIQNLIAESQFEFVGTPTRVQVYATSDPAVGDAQLEVFFGQELEFAKSPINLAAAAGQGPKTNEDLIADDVAAPGDRITITASETAGALAAEVRVLVSFTPMPRR